MNRAETATAASMKYQTRIWTAELIETNNRSDGQTIKIDPIMDTDINTGYNLPGKNNNIYRILNQQLSEINLIELMRWQYNPLIASIQSRRENTDAGRLCVVPVVPLKPIETHWPAAIGWMTTSMASFIFNQLFASSMTAQLHRFQPISQEVASPCCLNHRFLVPRHPGSSRIIRDHPELNPASILSFLLLVSNASQASQLLLLLLPSSSFFFLPPPSSSFLLQGSDPAGSAAHYKRPMIDCAITGRRGNKKRLEKNLLTSRRLFQVHIEIQTVDCFLFSVVI